MENRKGLSGWKRLWFLVGTLYAMVVVAFVALGWPSADSGVRTFTVRNNETGQRFEFDFYGSREPSDAEIEEIRLQQSASGKSLSTDPNYGTPLAIVLPLKIEGRPPIYFSAGTRESTIDQVVRRHVDGPRPERWRQMGWAALAWVVPMVFVYALGWGVGWVNRGFRSDGQNDNTSGPRLGA